MRECHGITSSCRSSQCRRHDRRNRLPGESLGSRPLLPHRPPRYGKWMEWYGTDNAAKAWLVTLPPEQPPRLRNGLQTTERRCSSSGRFLIAATPENAGWALSGGRSSHATRIRERPFERTPSAASGGRSRWSMGRRPRPSFEAVSRNRGSCPDSFPRSSHWLRFST